MISLHDSSDPLPESGRPAYASNHPLLLIGVAVLFGTIFLFGAYFVFQIANVFRFDPVYVYTTVVLIVSSMFLIGMGMLISSNKRAKQCANMYQNAYLQEERKEKTYSTEMRIRKKTHKKSVKSE